MATGLKYSSLMVVCLPEPFFVNDKEPCACAGPCFNVDGGGQSIIQKSGGLLFPPGANCHLEDLL